MCDWAWRCFRLCAISAWISALQNARYALRWFPLKVCRFVGSLESCPHACCLIAVAAVTSSCCQAGCNRSGQRPLPLAWPPCDARAPSSSGFGLDRICADACNVAADANQDPKTCRFLSSGLTSLHSCMISCALMVASSPSSLLLRAAHLSSRVSRRCPSCAGRGKKQSSVRQWEARCPWA